MTDVPTIEAQRSRPRPVLSPSSIGDANRSRVLQALCDNGPLSRADLARLSDVPRATISGIVRPLLDSGLLEEGEPDRSTARVGKPGRPLWFRSKAGLSVAIALREDACEAALVSARGELLEFHHAPVRDANDLRAITLDIVGGASAVTPKRTEVLGVGIAVPGVCDTATGSVLASSQLPGLDRHALAPAVSERFAAQVLVDNDSRAQALGEKWFGDGRGSRSFAAIQTGYGIGAGLVMDGIIYRGGDGLVGEVGHLQVAPGGDRCHCGLTGCWETVATLPWLRAQARAAGLEGARTMDAHALASLAAGGDASATELLDRYAENLSLGLAAITQMLNPDRIILHGDAVGGGRPLVDRVRDHTRARVIEPLRDVEVLASGLDQNATLLGAAGLVLSETFHLAT